MSSDDSPKKVDSGEPLPPVELTPAERDLVDELVADGLAIQHKFRPKTLYRTTGKGSYAGDTVDEIKRAHAASEQAG